MEAHGVRGGKLLLIFNLDTWWGWVDSITPRPRFTPGERTPPVPIVQEAGQTPEPVWTQKLEKKSSAPVDDRTPIVQSVVSHYTGWATPAPMSIDTHSKNVGYPIFWCS
jgi:hypothetical protein